MHCQDDLGVHLQLQMQFLSWECYTSEIYWGLRIWRTNCRITCGAESRFDWWVCLRWWVKRPSIDRNHFVPLQWHSPGWKQRTARFGWAAQLRSWPDPPRTHFWLCTREACWQPCCSYYCRCPSRALWSLATVGLWRCAAAWWWLRTESVHSGSCLKFHCLPLQGAWPVRCWLRSQCRWPTEWFESCCTRISPFGLPIQH